MQSLLLYNFFTKQQKNALKHPQIVNLYDFKFNFLYVYGTYRFNFQLLFEKELTPICLTLQLLKTD